MAKARREEAAAEARATAAEAEAKAAEAELAAVRVAAKELASLEARYWHQLNDLQLATRTHISTRDALLRKVCRTYRESIMLGGCKAVALQRHSAANALALLAHDAACLLYAQHILVNFHLTTPGDVPPHDRGAVHQVWQNGN